MTWHLRSASEIRKPQRAVQSVGSGRGRENERAPIRSERRTFRIVKARQIAMWLAKRFTSRSLPDIGRCIGGRDHTTVLHGCRRAEKVAEAIEAEAGSGTSAWGLLEWAQALWRAEWRGLGACR